VTRRAEYQASAGPPSGFLRNAPFAGALLDANLNALHANPALEALTGGAAAWLDALPEGTRDALRRVAFGTRPEAVLRVRAAGDPRVWTLTAFPVRERAHPGPLLGLMVHATEPEPLDRLRTLQEVTSALGQALTTTEVARVVTQQGVRATGAFAGTLVMPGPAGTLVTRDAVGYEADIVEPWRTFPADADVPVADALRDARAVFLHAHDAHARYPAIAAFLRGRTRAVAAIPLAYAGQVLGGMTLAFDHDDALLPDGQAYALTVAEQCAHALERARLYDAQRNAYERAALLAQASDMLTSTLNVRETLAAVTELAIEHVADWCSVHLPPEEFRQDERETRRLNLVAVAHRDPTRVAFLRDLLEAPPNPASPHSNERIYWSGEPRLTSAFPDAWIAAMPEAPQRDATHAFGRHAVMTVPMIARGRPVGLLQLATRTHERAYGPDDLAFAVELARRAALALENAALYEAATRSEERYRSLVDATRQTVWITDPQGRVTQELPGWSRMTGQAGEAFTEDGWLTRIHPDDRDTARTAWNDAVARLVPYEAEYRLRAPTGEYRHVHARGVPVLTPQGDVREWVGVTTDITDRVEATRAVHDLNAHLEELVAARTAELERANRDLRRSNEELERFAYVASHDLQEPLRTIASFTEVVNRRYGDRLDDQGRDFLRLVVQGAERMKDLIEDLLSYSRVSRVSPALRPVHASRPFREALARVQARAQATGASVTHGPLPVVLGDEMELTQLFQNLLSNAMKFHRPGVPPRVHVTAERNGKEWHFRVTDNGIGIEERYRERIFGLFQRLHTPGTYGGTGIGLAIVQKVIQRHDGRLWLDSTPGEGSTFHFTLRAANGTGGAPVG